MKRYVVNLVGRQADTARVHLVDDYNRDAERQLTRCGQVLRVKLYSASKHPHRPMCNKCAGRPV